MSMTSERPRWVLVSTVNDWLFHQETALMHAMVIFSPKTIYAGHLNVLGLPGQYRWGMVPTIARRSLPRMAWWTGWKARLCWSFSCRYCLYRLPLGQGFLCRQISRWACWEISPVVIIFIGCLHGKVSSVFHSARDYRRCRLTQELTFISAWPLHNEGRGWLTYHSVTSSKISLVFISPCGPIWPHHARTAEISNYTSSRRLWVSLTFQTKFIFRGVVTLLGIIISPNIRSKLNSFVVFSSILWGHATQIKSLKPLGTYCLPMEINKVLSYLNLLNIPIIPNKIRRHRSVERNRLSAKQYVRTDTREVPMVNSIWYCTKLTKSPQKRRNRIWFWVR